MSVRRALRVAVCLGLVGCGQETVEVELRSLQASSEMTFICRNGPRDAIPGDQAFPGEGRELAACPDYEVLDDPTLGAEFATRLYTVITQPATDEVALIDNWEADVVDLDRSVPGYSFLRLPSRPGDIASTPGGRASFVGLTTLNKTGIAAIPTTCLGNPSSSQFGRDVTSFAACSLPAVPGEITVVIEPPNADGVVAAACGSSDAEEPNPPGADAGRECGANLTTEDGPRGRRKLVVSLPDLGQLVVLDAQTILDAAPGSFGACAIEHTLELSSEVDPAARRQTPPPELKAPPGCSLSYPAHPEPPPSFAARPAGFAVEGSRLYVADEGAPLIHVLDTSSVCGLAELPPLLPMAFDDPERIVYTSRLAASPLTPSGKRFVYAIDKTDLPPSVMAFDVSTSSTDRTPIVRPGSVRTLFEPPDRIQFSAPAADVAFALRDLPLADPVTGVAEEGVHCDPNPAIDQSSAAALYRPNSDQTEGARPRLLRGLFGLVMLSNGLVTVIDVDDFDAPCRRPRTTNASDTPDFRGCFGDTDLPQTQPWLVAANGRLTVTDEVSCNMVQPHRARSATFGLVSSNAGVTAPSLRALPQFATPDLSSQGTIEERPKLLGVPFEPATPDGAEVPPVVNVGNTSYGETTPLPIDPNTADQSSLTLPLAEPRAYPGSDRAQVIYEGAITGTFPSGFVHLTTEPDLNLGTYGSLDDSTASFCDRGVSDLDVMREFGREELGIQSDTEARAFAEFHADYVQITGDFPEPRDPYWVLARAPECSDVDRAVCSRVFGSHTARDLEPARELTVVEAYQGKLSVKPRNAASAEEAAETARMISCCFPAGTEYTVRASRQWVMLTESAPRFRHDITAREEAGQFRCVRDCDPRRRYDRSRIFELTSSEPCSDCRVGATRAEPGLDVCGYDANQGAVKLGEPAAACIFENLNARFAIYRGLQPSVRGMSFTWTTSGGFVTLAASLTSLSSAVSPQRINYLPEYQAFAVLDAASLGLSLISLDNLRIDDPWPVY
jgi:hypothetical protein